MATTVSRTARVILNAKVALMFYVINLTLQFFSRKIFLDYLGADLLGLNTTAQNLLQFLNLAESGIGAAVSFALYKPLSQNNRSEINEIISVQGWLYRWVGTFIIIGSIILMAFFPLIFAKANIPLVYSYGVFSAFLVSVLLSYFVNYKIVVLSADQQEYKITIETQRIRLAKVIFQMLLISHLSYGYVWWIVLEVISSILISLRLIYCIKKEYPWLHADVQRGKSLQKKYVFIVKKIKQLFFHRMSGCILTQSTPLVIYVFTNLSDVAIYGNYLVIMSGCLLFINSLFLGFNSGVGNLVATSSTKFIKKIFWEITTLRLFVSSIVCSGVLLLSDSFVNLWVGREYIMGDVPFVLMVSIYFIQMTRTNDVFLSAYGLFHDIWAPIIEILLSLSLSITLGLVWGLSGILSGVLLSQIVVVNSWKAYFLYRNGFKENTVCEYIILYTKKVFFAFVALVITISLRKYLIDIEVFSFTMWILEALITTLFYSIVLGCFYLLFDKSFRTLVIFFRFKML